MAGAVDSFMSSPVSGHSVLCACTGEQFIPYPNLEVHDGKYQRVNYDNQTLEPIGRCHVHILKCFDSKVSFFDDDSSKVTLEINLNGIITDTVKYNIKNHNYHDIRCLRGNREFPTILHLDKGKEFEKFYAKLLEVITSLQEHKRNNTAPKETYRLIATKEKQTTLEARSGTSQYKKNDELAFDHDFKAAQFFIGPKSEASTHGHRPRSYTDSLLDVRYKHVVSTNTLKLGQRSVVHDNDPESNGARLKTTPTKDSGQKSILVKESEHKANFVQDSEQKSISVKDSEQKTIPVQESEKTIPLEESEQKTIPAKDSGQKTIPAKDSGQKAIPVKESEHKTSHFANCNVVMNLNRGPAEELKKIGELLQTSINTKDKENAEKYAGLLARQGVKVTVLIEENSPKYAQESEFSIKVYVEDREASGGCINLKVKPTDTVKDLKNMMYLKHNFPVEVQKWIIGKRIPADRETLHKAKVTAGQALYLYLVSAKSVKLIKEEYMANREQMILNQGNIMLNRPAQLPESGDFATLASPLTPQTPYSQPTPSTSSIPGHVLNKQKSKEGPPKGRPLNQGQVEQKLPHQRPVPVEQPEDQVAQEIRPEAAMHLPHMPAPPKAPKHQQVIGWQCPACTFINLPTRPGCEICTGARPKTYVIPEGYVMTEEEKERLRKESEVEKQAQLLEAKRQEKERQRRQENFQQLLQVEGQSLIPNTSEFECSICFDTIRPGQGVVLRECLHSFCRDCLTGAIQYNEEAELKCPFQNDNYSCQASLQDREIRATVQEKEQEGSHMTDGLLIQLVPPHLYEKYLQRSLSTAESQAQNSFHCKVTDCPGWCIYEDHVNFFKCPVCDHENCLTCKAIHQGMNCKQYQEDLKARAQNDAAARQTQEMLQEMIRKGDAMNCPQCQVIVQKKDGCDWIKCSICKTEICWVTKGPRWGPNGPGDISGGCGCRVNGRKCHETCNNCH